MTKPKRPLTSVEFNSAVLDRVLAQAMPAEQRDDEFSVIEMVARGMSESAARRYCMTAVKRGAMSRRIGTPRTSRRKVWLYKMNGGK